MGYLMLVFERSFHMDLKSEKKFKYVKPIKRYNVKKFKFSAILLLKIAKTQILKRSIFWLDKRFENPFEALIFSRLFFPIA